jgi:hypothetical protein
MPRFRLTNDYGSITRDLVSGYRTLSNCHYLFRGPVKFIFAIRAGNLNFAFIYRHPQPGVALVAFDDPMINQFQDSAFVQSDHNVLPYQKCRYTPDFSHDHFLAGFLVNVNILFYETYLILRKKLFRLGTVWSGFGGKHDHLLHFVSSLRNII